MRLAPAVITATSPLAASIQGGPAVLAIGIVGLNYPVGTHCVAMVQEGAIPVVAPVGTTVGTDTVIDGNA